MKREKPNEAVISFAKEAHSQGLTYGQLQAKEYAIKISRNEPKFHRQKIQTSSGKVFT